MFNNKLNTQRKYKNNNKKKEVAWRSWGRLLFWCEMRLRREFLVDDDGWWWSWDVRRKKKKGREEMICHGFMIEVMMIERRSGCERAAVKVWVRRWGICCGVYRGDDPYGDGDDDIYREERRGVIRVSN